MFSWRNIYDKVRWIKTILISEIFLFKHKTINKHEIELIELLKLNSVNCSKFDVCS